MQEQSGKGQQLSAQRIADLEREASDSRDVHLALAAQHESKVPHLFVRTLLHSVLQCCMPCKANVEWFMLSVA